MSPPSPHLPPNGESDHGDRLESWKEIAAYLGRGVRTVIRWEAEDGLPIHRRIHGSRGSVYAYKRELDAWIQSRTVSRRPTEPAATQAGMAEPRLERGPAERVIRRRTGWLISVAASLVAILAVATWITTGSGTPRPALAIVPLTTYPGTEIYPTLSPDGSRVAFAWDGDRADGFDLYETTLGSEAKPLRLTHQPSRHLFAAWSPDGSRIAFARSTTGDQYELAVVPALGGGEQHVADILSNIRNPSVTWTPDGAFLIAPSHPAIGGPDKLYLIPREGGKMRRLQTEVSASTGENNAMFSSDGRWLTLVYSPTPGTQEVSVLPVTKGWQVGGASRVIDRGLSCCFTQLMGMMSQELLYSRSRPATASLARVRLPDGQPRMASGIGQLGWGGVTLNPSTDNLVYSDYRRGYRIWRLDLIAGQLQPKSFLSSAEYERSPAISPDGKEVAFMSARLGNGAIWVRDGEGNEHQLTHLASGGAPRWSPDGKQIAFDASTDGKMDVYVVDAGGGPARRITNAPGFHVLPSWSADGKRIYYASNRGGEVRIWSLPATGEGEPKQVTSQRSWLAQESKDGQTLYFTQAASSSGEADIWEKPLQGGQESLLIRGINNVRNFAVVKDGIYYERNRSRSEFEILFFRFNDRQSRKVAAIGKSAFEGLSVAPSSDWLLFSTVEEHAGDLWLVKNLQ